MRVKRRIVATCAIVLLPIVSCSFVLISCVGWNAPDVRVNWISYEPELFVNCIAYNHGDIEGAHMDITDIHGNVVRAIPMIFNIRPCFYIEIISGEVDDNGDTIYKSRNIFLASKIKNNKRKGYFVASNITTDELFDFKYKSITFYRVD